MEPQAPQIPEAMPAAPEQGPDQQAPTVEAAPVAPTPEVQAGSSEGANQGASVQLPPIMPAAPVLPVQDPIDPAASVGQPGVVVTSPPVADDIDIIEKEWVDKAKAIVEKTKADPHQQSTEVNALKADYLKKRYGKDVKVTDS